MATSVTGRTRRRDRRRRRWEAVYGQGLKNPRLNSIVQRNIDRLEELRAEIDHNKCFKDRLAEQITRWSGSMTFLVLHALWFAAWIVMNETFPVARRFDPGFTMLTMIVSLEAIFLTVFVLISQNRQSEVDSERNELDLQIDLLAEYELTRVLTLVDAIADHMGLKVGGDPDLDELKRDVAPEAVVRELQQRKEEARQRPSKAAPLNGGAAPAAAPGARDGGA